MAERRIGHFFEAIGAWGLFQFFRLLSIDHASAVGGFLARTIGPRLRATRRAVVNLRRAMPELDDAEIRHIVVGMWDNLGRVVAEYPHLGEVEIFKRGGRVETIGTEPYFSGQKDGKRYIFFSAHYGNWEIATLAATQAKYRVAQVYRAANNPLIDRLILEARGPIGSELIAKGPAAARQILKAVESGHALCMLVDQKMNDGIAVPFFGRDAMTAPALARLARRFDCVVVPARVERIEGAHFRFVCEAPLAVPRTHDQHADVLALMSAVNQTVERWIRADPKQWFWLHRRWPD